MADPDGDFRAAARTSDTFEITAAVPKQYVLVSSRRDVLNVGIQPPQQRGCITLRLRGRHEERINGDEGREGVRHR